MVNTDCKQAVDVVEKIKNMIEHSKTKEQLKATRRFVELFIRNMGAITEASELNGILVEKEKNLVY